MSKSKSSAKWLAAHQADEFVRLARKQGLRSRAALKLKEMDARRRILRPGMTVIDLGAAPGGWSQVAAQAVHAKGRASPAADGSGQRAAVQAVGGKCQAGTAADGSSQQAAAQAQGQQGQVIALDLLPMEPIPGVAFIQGDFTDPAVQQRLITHLGGQQADLVLSDLAPNLSGLKDIDQPRSIHLAELALDLARQALKPGGSLLLKTFEGEGTETLRASLREAFAKCRTLKPKASRPASRELYLYAEGYKQLPSL